ncbi:MAG: DUF1802 family protein [Cyanobacteria bacterium J06598_1]
MLLTAALKEWSVAVEALTSGETVLLLRKGGIKEEKGRFSAVTDQVVLFPTFEHQKRELLKSQYQSSVEPVPSGWHPQIVQIKAWAEITHIFLTQDADRVAALSPLHIWQPQLAQERLKWKANQPLYVLALRAYRFLSPSEIAWQDSYGGCRSWISLETGMETTGSEPAIATPEYLRQVAEIEACLTA